MQTNPENTDNLLERCAERLRRNGFEVVILPDEKAAGASGSDMVPRLVETLLDIRQKAKAAKDWAASDAIRDRLTEIGIRVKDRKDGVDWEIE